MTDRKMPQPILVTALEPSKGYSEFDNYAHLRILVGYLEEGRIRYFQNYDCNPGKLYADLEINCQINGKPLKDDGFPSYAWRAEYKTYSVELREAEQMVKTLKAIQRKMSAYYEELGNPQTYGQYATRFALAIGAKQIACAEPAEAKLREYNFLSTGNAIAWIDQRILLLKNQCLENAGHPAIAQAA